MIFGQQAGAWVGGWVVMVVVVVAGMVVVVDCVPKGSVATSHPL